MSCLHLINYDLYKCSFRNSWKIRVNFSCHSRLYIQIKGQYVDYCKKIKECRQLSQIVVASGKWWCGGVAADG